MKFGRDIHGPQRITNNNFEDLTFHLAPQAGQTFHLSREISYTRLLAQNSDDFSFTITRKFTFLALSENILTVYYWMDCQEIWCTQSYPPQDEL